VCLRCSTWACATCASGQRFLVPLARVLALLNEKFNLMAITTADADLAAMLRNGATHDRRCPELIASPGIASFVLLSQHTPTRAARLYTMSTERMIWRLSWKTALLSNLTPAEIQLLSRVPCASLTCWSSLLRGEPCHGLHIIGVADRIFKTSLGGREQFGCNHPGESVAELPVFDGGPYPRPRWPLKTLRLPYLRRDFQAYCMEHPAVRSRCWPWWARVCGGCRHHRGAFIYHHPSALISTLLRLAESEGKQTRRGIEFSCPQPPGVANQLGTVRELISRNLMRLQAEGLLDVDAREIVVRT